jgi:hypothetical protein
MSDCAGRRVLANGSSRTRQRERNSSLVGVNLVVRAFKKEMQEKQWSPRDRWQIGCIRPEINPPERLEASGALAEPELT